MPKIAPYAFTTLHPHMGKLKFDNYKEIIIEDLPGLIEGAHINKGLGHRFLKHIERAKILIFLLDGSNNPSSIRNPANDLLVLKNELLQYKQNLMDKPYIVVINKNDKIEKKLFDQNVEAVKKVLKNSNVYLLDISAKYSNNLNKLVSLIYYLNEKVSNN